MKQEFEMLQSEMDFILDINKHNSNTVMMIGGVDFSNNLTEAVNAYWKELGDKYGFKWNTVEGSAKGNLFFLAEPKPIVVPLTESEKHILEYVGDSLNYINCDIRKALRKIITQLESCEYENEAGVLKMNVAFLALKKMSEDRI